MFLFFFFVLLVVFPMLMLTFVNHPCCVLVCAAVSVNQGVIVRVNLGLAPFKYPPVAPYKPVFNTGANTPAPTPSAAAVATPVASPAAPAVAAADDESALKRRKVADADAAAAEPVLTSEVPTTTATDAPVASDGELKPVVNMRAVKVCTSVEPVLL